MVGSLFEEIRARAVEIRVAATGVRRAGNRLTAIDKQFILVFQTEMKQFTGEYVKKLKKPQKTAIVQELEQAEKEARRLKANGYSAEQILEDLQVRVVVTVRPNSKSLQSSQSQPKYSAEAIRHRLVRAGQSVGLPLALTGSHKRRSCRPLNLNPTNITLRHTSLQATCDSTSVRDRRPLRLTSLTHTTSTPAAEFSTRSPSSSASATRCRDTASRGRRGRRRSTGGHSKAPPPSAGRRPAYGRLKGTADTAEARVGLVDGRGCQLETKADRFHSPRLNRPLSRAAFSCLPCGVCGLLTVNAPANRAFRRNEWPFLRDDSPSSSTSRSPRSLAVLVHLTAQWLSKASPAYPNGARNTADTLARTRLSFAKQAAIDKSSVHRLTSGQVVIDLQSAGA